MKYDSFIELLGRLGVNTYIDNNQMYFMTYDNKKRYKITYFDFTNKEFAFKKSASLDDMQGFYQQFGLSSDNKQYIRVGGTLEPRGDKVIMIGCYIEDKTHYYSMMKVGPQIRFERGKRNDNNNTDYTEIIIYKDRLYTSTCSLTEYTNEVYYLDKESNPNYKNMKKAIESFKYFDLFLEYYSKFGLDFMDIYNSFMVDSVYIGR